MCKSIVEAVLGIDEHDPAHEWLVAYEERKEAEKRYEEAKKRFEEVDAKRKEREKEERLQAWACGREAGKCI